MKGYMGKILKVNLTTGEFQEEIIPDEVYEQVLSGIGIGAYVLYKNIPENCDPLGPDNMLGFTAGLLTGTHTFMSGRWMAMAKSPATGTWCDANGGGTFAPQIKKCGYDGIFISGISPKPVYLYVGKKGPELRDASHVWGTGALAAEKKLTEECMDGKRVPRIALIGESGEKLSKISGIVNDYGRIAARGGLGAVMGSKNLKAVVLNGVRRVRYSDPEKMKELTKDFAKKVQSTNFPNLLTQKVVNFGVHQGTRSKKAAPSDSLPLMSGVTKKWGTIAGTQTAIIQGDAPIKNWAGDNTEFTARDGKNFNADKVLKREYEKYHCYACSMGCGGKVKMSDLGKGEFKSGHKPEYETMATLGPLCMNKDADAVIYMNEMLNDAGMDTISAGATVGFAIECFENGLLTKKDTNGLELTWGNTDAIVETIKLMIKREGIGDLLADGTKAAAEKIGGKAADYAIHAGGLEPGAHDPRVTPGLGLGYSADAIPGRHTQCCNHYGELKLWERVSWAPEEKERPVEHDFNITLESGIQGMGALAYRILIDVSGVCLIIGETGCTNYKLFDYMDAATGWNKNADYYMDIGRRVLTLRQMFNVKQGVKPIDNLLHKRMGSPLSAGPTKGRSVDFEAQTKYYWEAMGFDKDGIPTQETIKKYGLDTLVQ